jgi:Fe-S-cluster containining protein
MKRPSGLARTQIELSLLGAPFRLAFEAPQAPVRPRRLLPVFQAVTDEIVSRSARAVAAEGKEISCRAGCGACCRQLVPISETEARALTELVKGAPHARRSALRARFAEAQRKLEELGLWQRLSAHRDLPREEMTRLGDDYFQAGIACPFLEDESCSIHPDRPLSCREFLVTSAAEHCASLDRESIVDVPIPGHASDALARIDAKTDDGRQWYWLPLIQALDFTQAHPDKLSPEPVPQILERFFAILAALGDDPPAEPT